MTTQTRQGISPADFADDRAHKDWIYDDRYGQFWLGRVVALRRGPMLLGHVIGFGTVMSSKGPVPTIRIKWMDGGDGADLVENITVL